MLSDFIRKEVDLLCISVGWRSRFEPVCDFIAQLPEEVTTIVGGYQATLEVETVFERCPNVDCGRAGRGRGDHQAGRDGRSFREHSRALLPSRWPDRAQREPGAARAWSTSPFPIGLCAGTNTTGAATAFGSAVHTFDTVLTARGCPFKCKFCTFSLNPLGQKREYTERPVESVIEELKTITADIVLFSDDNFATNPATGRATVRPDHRERHSQDVRRPGPHRHRPAPPAPRQGLAGGFQGLPDRHRVAARPDPGANCRKGITQQQVREAFAILTQYDFFLHGYFIYGNVGETEEEMLYIPKFAQEIGLDSISFQKLRVEKFSPLEGDRGGDARLLLRADRRPRVFRQVRPKGAQANPQPIRSEFYNVRQLLRIAGKAQRIGLVTTRDIAGVVLKLPFMVRCAITDRIEKKRARRQRQAARMHQAAQGERPKVTA